ncbi:MAG: hypothetical protein PWQ29_408 [Verrucomicrobiota bacterium]|jgi:hypothetical protein|nr:hypothetical protein [Verrucomicrobiota bacterium]MDK2963014.1 hypothetical protein [Verrucomicrobiota bacterium]
MRSNEARRWEKNLKSVFDVIDAELEAEYGSNYTRNPVRPEKGTTSNPESDGLFNVGAAFSAGYGSKYGPGYIVETRLSTLEKVPEDIRSEIRRKIFQRLEDLLPGAFPGKELHVSEENGIIRIHGDLSLDD